MTIRGSRAAQILCRRAIIYIIIAHVFLNNQNRKYMKDNIYMNLDHSLFFWSKWITIVCNLINTLQLSNIFIYPDTVFNSFGQLVIRASIIQIVTANHHYEHIVSSACCKWWKSIPVAILSPNNAMSIIRFIHIDIFESIWPILLLVRQLCIF